MTTQEFKKKICDTVEPLLNGQGQVRFKVYEYATFDQLSITWWNIDDELIASADIAETPQLTLYEYNIHCRYCYDWHGKLGRLASAYAECPFNDPYDYFFEDWTGVEKVLQTFTEYLVKEFN